MITDKLEQLTAARARVAELEKAMAAESASELAALPGAYGFDNVDSFVAAVKAATGVRRGRPRASQKAVAKPKRGKRAKITDAMRAELKTLVGAGKTGKEIAKALGISLPSVANVKAALGLSKKRK